MKKYPMLIPANISISGYKTYQCLSFDPGGYDPEIYNKVYNVPANETSQEAICSLCNKSNTGGKYGCPNNRGDRMRKPSEIISDMIYNRGIDTAVMTETKCEERQKELETELEESMKSLALRIVLKKIASLGR